MYTNRMLFPKSFKGLLDFGYQRRGMEIPTFYFVYLIGSVMIGAICGMLVSLATGSDTARITWRVDYIAASILYLVVTHQIIKKKTMGTQSPIIWLLPIATAALTLYIGHIVALIIPTILSARPNKNTAKASANPEPQTQTSQDASKQSPSE